jgi:galactose-1-phosphate uridylyltransferase
MTRIRFERRFEKSGFFSPLAGMQFTEQTIEVRTDPLTGFTSVASSELATKEEMFFGKTDWDHAEELARRSRKGCFFCPEKVHDVTPKYPHELIEGGRLELGPAIVFPNLFPLAAVHAVACYPRHHFLRPSQFTSELLEAGLGVAVDFAARAEHHFPQLDHLQICCNHMLPAGASLVHPHFQIFGGEHVPWLVRHSWDKSAQFKADHGVPYWTVLVEEEAEIGERYIADDAGCHWLVPWAPTGGREVLAVVADREHFWQLEPKHIAALARGLSRVLAWYERESLSAFNFTIFTGPLKEPGTGYAVILRVIARSAFKPDYRTDDYFLQKQLGGELIFASPEEMATQLRADFGAA